ncbi:MAG: ComF family protein [Gammaproteobacteria bacterium]|nr:ComF family protein [Gammaproteobacteria bacterium]
MAQTFLCQLCRVRLQFVAHYAHCLCCSELLFVEANQSKCGRCLKDPPYFQETHACFIYEALIAHLIQGLKFSGRLQVLPFLVEEMTEALKKSYGERPFPDLIIPVPLQYSGQFKRGFNQAHELGRRLAKNLSMPYSSLVAHKTQGTQAQARLTKKERVRNLKGHFQIQKMQGVKSVALIDDVMTTGSTLRELAHALHQAGVEEVHLWVVARARL